MKKTNSAGKILNVILILLLFCTQSLFAQDYSKMLVGTWYNSTDEDYILIFHENGTFEFNCWTKKYRGRERLGRGPNGEMTTAIGFKSKGTWSVIDKNVLHREYTWVFEKILCLRLFLVPQKKCTSYCAEIWKIKKVAYSDYSKSLMTVFKLFFISNCIRS